MRASGLFLPQRHGCIVGLSIEARQAPREWEVSGEEDGANAMGDIQKDMVRAEWAFASTATLREDGGKK